MAHIEYKCGRCQETYLPSEPGEEHAVRNDGRECGAKGEYSGVWYAPLERRNLEREHMFEFPECSDPDCEFHHPEVRES